MIDFPTELWFIHLCLYATEQKRRQAIRDGFDKLCEIVPGLEGQGRSEGLVLSRTVVYMREQLEVRRMLIQEREARGEVVDEKFKEYVKNLYQKRFC